jgi:hypothetical protein
LEILIKAFRYLTHIAAVDGALLGDEEKMLTQVAEELGIPANAAKQVFYESLAMFLQAKRTGENSGHQFKMAA